MKPTSSPSSRSSTPSRPQSSEERTRRANRLAVELFRAARRAPRGRSDGGGRCRPSRGWSRPPGRSSRGRGNAAAMISARFAGKSARRVLMPAPSAVVRPRFASLVPHHVHFVTAGTWGRGLVGENPSALANREGCAGAGPRNGESDSVPFGTDHQPDADTGPRTRRNAGHAPLHDRKPRPGGSTGTRVAGAGRCRRTARRSTSVSMSAGEDRAWPCLRRPRPPAAASFATSRPKEPGRPAPPRGGAVVLFDLAGRHAHMHGRTRATPGCRKSRRRVEVVAPRHEARTEEYVSSGRRSSPRRTAGRTASTPRPVSRKPHAACPGRTAPAPCRTAAPSLPRCAPSNRIIVPAGGGGPKNFHRTPRRSAGGFGPRPVRLFQVPRPEDVHRGVGQYGVRLAIRGSGVRRRTTSPADCTSRVPSMPSFPCRSRLRIIWKIGRETCSSARSIEPFARARLLVCSI